MENRVAEISLVTDGFIHIPNHTNCAKFEGNLSPPSVHGKILHEAFHLYNLRAIYSICRLTDFINGILHAAKANLDHPKQSLHPELPPWLLHPSFISHSYHTALEATPYCPTREKSFGEGAEQPLLQSLRPVPLNDTSVGEDESRGGWSESKSNIDVEVDDSPSKDDSTARFHCQTCGQGFPSASQLLGHEHRHVSQARPHQCEICFKGFATNSHLTTHKRTHTGERPYRCQVCHRSFSDRSAFVKHERTHGPDGTIVKRYKCELCGNLFSDNCGLKKHIRTHTGERPYQCDVCDKSFSTSSTFVAHRRIHTGERPYKCEQCSKMFITKSHLSTHGRIHSGEKPFVCPVCSRNFADGSSFRRHERLHTGEQRHNCQVCGKVFPVSSSLHKHMQQSHSYTARPPYRHQSPLLPPISTSPHFQELSKLKDNARH